MKKKIYVLTGQCGYDALGISVSMDVSELQKKMEDAYESALSDLDGDYEGQMSGTSCGEYMATIVTSGDCYDWAITTHEIEFDEVISFSLPNGITIMSELRSDDEHENRRTWKSIDIVAKYTNGIVNPLCSLEWEAEHGARALVFELNEDEPAYIEQYKGLDALLEVDVGELSRRLCTLSNGNSINFYADKDENGGIDAYGAIRFDAFEANHIILNYYGGNSPYVIDLTSAEDDEIALTEALVGYFENCGIKETVFLDVTSEKGLNENGK